MMTGKIIGIVSAKDYFEHEESYYTKNQSCYDRWHGSLGKTLGADGEVSKEQFDYLMDSIGESGRIRGGIDCPFSAPKSCSLAMAADEQTRLDMIQCHQEAVAEIAKKIEMEYIVADGSQELSRNMCAAEFLHTTARPTAENGYVPDLDLHSHLVITNMTQFDGQNRALNFGKIQQNYKHLGLEYRRIYASKLQARGYALDLTDPRQGFFELQGFSRDTIEKYSHRSAEVKEYADAHPDATPQQAKALSRSAKDKATRNYEELCEDVRKDLFSGKIKIVKREAETNARENERREKALHDGKSQERARVKRDHDLRRDAADRTRSKNPVSRGRQSDDSTFDDASRRGLEDFAERSRVSELPSFDVAEESGRNRLLVSGSKLSRLAQLQTARVRDYYMQRAQEIRRGRDIDEIADRALKRLSAEKFAFSVREAQDRIVAEGLLENVRQEEAEAALERAEVVRLGRLEGDKRNEYLTTEDNLKTEQRIIDRVKEGKGVITKNMMTQEEANAALHRAEARIGDGKHLNPEQISSVEHIMVCRDRFCGVNGLAGTGKTMMLQRVREIADEQGIRIEGACFTGKAASGLEADSQIKSGTIHSFLNRLERESGAKPPPGQGDGEIRQKWDFSKVQKAPTREMWIVDEAGLVDNNLMDQLQAAAEARGAQVVLVGDPDQLPPVGLGEPMRAMEENGMATAHMTEIRRQTDLELRRAVSASVSHDADGKPHLTTFEILEKKGDYREIRSRADKREAIKKVMTAEKLDTYKDRLLLTSTNAERKALNKIIRKEYVARGELSQGKKFEITVSDNNGKTHTETRQFAEKDRVILTANDNRAGVLNGELGAIEKIDGNRITVKIDTKPDEPPRIVTIDTAQYNSLDHSYCLTNYKAQGMTIDLVVADMDTKGAAQTRNSLYVDISRARKRAIVFTDSKSKLEKQTLNFAKKITSKDFADRIDKMKAQQGIKNNDRYHAPTRDFKAEMTRALNGVRRHTLGASERGLSMNRMAEKAVSIPIKVTGQMIQAAADVVSLVPVVGKVIAAPAKVVGKGIEIAGKAVGKAVKITVKTAEKTISFAKNVSEKAVSMGQRQAERWKDAERAAEANAKYNPPKQQEYERPYVLER